VCGDVESEWTALLVGFLIAGAGAGLVNPTLAERVKIKSGGSRSAVRWERLRRAHPAEP